MYCIDIMTLFPHSIEGVLSESILGRAQERNLLRIQTHQIRDYTVNRQNQVDDYPYGGGRGAVLQADPLYRCWEYIRQQGDSRPHTIFLSPCGKPFTQADAKRLAWQHSHLILVCGHYEGIDQRFIDGYVDEELSLGDFVLTGGEIAAMAVADAVSRLVPGVLADRSCYEEESHWDGLLEYPQYSRPAVWHDMEVPKVLSTGNHTAIARWRRKQSILRTMQRRPDLYEKLDLSSKEDRQLLSELEWELSRPALPQPVACRPAQKDDLDAMETILEQAKALLTKRRIDQWNQNYPVREDFLEDIARGECYVLTCGGVIGGFFTLSTQPEPEYATITDGRWRSEEPYVTLRRCAVAEQWRGSGLAHRMMDECGKLALSMGFHWLRTDTHKKNKAMQGLLRRHGLQYRGNVLVDAPEGHDPHRVAYEKRLEPARRD